MDVIHACTVGLSRVAQYIKRIQYIKYSNRIDFKDLYSILYDI